MKFTLVLSDGHSEKSVIIDAPASSTVLDALETSRVARESNIPYRHSCHHGSCGTCGAMINGKPRLMCVTRLGELGEGPVRIEPLKKMTMIAGIAVWPGPLFAALPDTAYVREFSSGGQKYKKLEDCIECGICVAACPVEKGFIGPAALTLAELEMENSRGQSEAMLALAASPEGVRACERAFECSKACPRNLAPGRRIAKLRSMLDDRGSSDQ